MTHGNRALAAAALPETANGRAASDHRRYRHLFFDLDGTLVRSRRARLSLDYLRGVHRELAPRVGEVRAFLALACVLRAFSRGDPAHTNAERAARAVADVTGLEPGAALNLLRASSARVFPRLARHFAPIPEAAAFVAWAARFYELHLATDPVFPQDAIECRLRWAGIEPAVFSSFSNVDGMHACKPSLRYFLELLDDGKRDPRHCLLIGDNVRKDAPAVAAGISVFIIGPEVAPRRISRDGEAPVVTGTWVALRQWLEQARAQPACGAVCEKRT